ncbi:hypothetical protein HS088_TW22G00635 [Tripterygium wilfordii]|uniref:Uncharacterized protein n=1 Tax=Tripterygium wilfordii TaxID=458696 RepID=A0A7J7BYH0_TRIWF|nr:hypothetical protein HS088_TW22G00635 [Tripterygium wilfordii]
METALIEYSSGEKLSGESSKKDPNQVEQLCRGGRSTEKLCRGSSKGKQVLQANEVEKLSKRLTILEEENKHMNQVLLNTLEERRILLNEIYQQFQEMHHCFHYTNRSCDGSLVAVPCEDRTLWRGLSQVLCQESSPYVVTGHSSKNCISGSAMTFSICHESFVGFAQVDRPIYWICKDG